MSRNISTTDTDQLHGRDLYADKLCHPEKYATAQPNGAKVEQEAPLDGDGQPLSGYDKYADRLCHPERYPAKKPASTGGR